MSIANEDPDAMDSVPGVAHEQLQGSVPALDSEADVRRAVEQAFDYRGDVAITTRGGRRIEGYLFDRRADSPVLDECILRMLPADAAEKVCIPYADIARIEFSGRDTASGKSWETWVRKYSEKKARGESNIRIDPEKLD